MWTVKSLLQSGWEWKELGLGKGAALNPPESNVGAFIGMYELRSGWQLKRQTNWTKSAALSRIMMDYVNQTRWL